MKQAIFREYSIRGKAEQELPDEIVYQIGQAIGTYLTQETAPKLVVGRDVRQSSPRISTTLIKGLTATGAAVFDIGLVPTPVLNFATDHLQATGGIMVTASHNPPADNGFKLRTDETLTGSALQAIYRVAIGGVFNAGPGRTRLEDALTPYFAALQKRAVAGPVKQIVIDGGNGCNGQLMSNFLRSLGHTVIEVFTEPDGTFPNRNPDPTGPDALVEASRRVLEARADFGLAYDGDGDRVALIDDAGQPHYGDIILMLLARQALLQGSTQIVHDVSCTQALVDDVLAGGGQAHASAVGYAYVHTKMRETGATLGGESAGHIFCLDDTFHFDDALLASVKLLNYIVSEGKPVSTLIAALPQYHTSPNIRLFCPDDDKAAVLSTLVNHYQATHPVNTIDGARASFEDGWALIRQSNTQPAISLRFEGQTADALARIETEVTNLVQKVLGEFGI